jgi:hypothetical protein
MPFAEPTRFEPKPAPDLLRSPLPSWMAPVLGTLLGSLSAIHAFQKHDGRMAWMLTGIMMALGFIAGLIVVAYDARRKRQINCQQRCLIDDGIRAHTVTSDSPERRSQPSNVGDGFGIID